MSGKEILEAFEPFRRIDHALTSNFEGIGLGLPLTKAMIEMHGGRLEIASISNHGTTATRVFPAERVRGPAERQRERAGDDAVRRNRKTFPYAVHQDKQGNTRALRHP